jgi:hypothetical protein
MANVSKEMVDAVRMARWADWERMAKEMQGGHHILSVELLRTQRTETAIVITVARNGRVHQFEFRADEKGQNPRPVITRRDPTGCDDAPKLEVAQVAALAIGAPTPPPPPPPGDDGGPVANSIPLGEPPPKEPPDPGVTSLGASLLQTTFDLGEQAVDSPPA